jgi:hypothetical protein
MQYFAIAMLVHGYSYYESSAWKRNHTVVCSRGTQILDAWLPRWPGIQAT